jgi:hypothetical protein
MKAVALFSLLAILACFPLHIYMESQPMTMDMSCSDCVPNTAGTLSLADHYQSMTNSVSFAFVLSLLALLFVGMVTSVRFDQLVRLGRRYRETSLKYSQPPFLDWLKLFTTSPPQTI